MGHILVVDDELSMREFLDILLRKAGHRVSLAADGEAALRLVEKDRPDLVVQDLKMPGMPGLELLGHFKACDPDMPVVVITAFSTWDSTVEAMRLGAHDYVKKPFDTDEIREVIERALGRRRILEQMRGRPELPELRAIVGNSPCMRTALELVRRVAPTESTVLIQGESGTGKELVARMLHYYSSRASHPFISVNCGALPEPLLESELFGHLRGTFTGAVTDKKGLIQVADGGTFFLDEVGELPLSTQVKLLRVLEERQFFPLGATRPVRVDVRIVAASNRILSDEVRRGNFRQDLYYRLNVIPITLPPLRSRREDIPLLAGYFVRKYASVLGREITGIAPAARRRLEEYSWPGNVRELENVIQRAIALARGNVIEDVELQEAQGAPVAPAGACVAPADAREAATTWPGVRRPLGAGFSWLPTVEVGLSQSGEARAPAPGAAPASGAAPARPAERAEASTGVSGASWVPPLPAIPEAGIDLESTLSAVERHYIEEALGRTDGNLTRAAELLGLSFRSIRYKVKKLGIRA